MNPLVYLLLPSFLENPAPNMYFTFLVSIHQPALCFLRNTPPSLLGLSEIEAVSLQTATRNVPMVFSTCLWKIILLSFFIFLIHLIIVPARKLVKNEKIYSI